MSGQSVIEGDTMKFIIATLCLALGSSACASNSTQSASDRPADQRLAAAVAEALLADAMVYAAHIDVRTEDGIVHLGGVVLEPADLPEATRTAARVPGVRAVVDEMELVNGG
jgi:osmotically-inducible protein OsmY